MVLSLVSGYSLPLGVYYDTESVGGGRANALSAAARTALSARRSATPGTARAFTPMPAGSITR